MTCIKIAYLLIFTFSVHEQEMCQINFNARGAGVKAIWTEYW